MLDPLDLKSPLPPGNANLPANVVGTNPLTGLTGPGWIMWITNDQTGETFGATRTQLAAAFAPTVPIVANALPNISLALDQDTLIIGRTVTLTATATDSDGTVVKVEFFDVATKIGEVLGSGPYALAYTPSTVGSHSLTAKATDNLGGARTTAPTNLPVLAAPNLLPNITLFASAATVQQGTAIVLTASVADIDGTVVLVEYYDGATRIGQTTAIPHSISYAPGQVGSHNLYGKATDNSGGATQSLPVTLNVVPNAINQAPTVSLSIIANNPVVGQAVLLNATAADSDGTVVLVEFYNAGTKIGQATQSPYSLSYVPTTAGAYFFSAKATDNSGATTQTAASFLLVNAALVLVQLTVPGAPTGVVGTAGNNQISVNWLAPDVTGGSAITAFAVYRDSDVAPLNANASKPYVDNTAINGTAHTYMVAATNSTGTGLKSAPSAAVTPTAGAVIAGPSYHGAVASPTPTATQIQAMTVEQWAFAPRSFGMACNNTYPCFAEPDTYPLRTLIQDKNGFNITGDVAVTAIILSVGGAAVGYRAYTHQNPQTTTNFILSL